MEDVYRLIDDIVVKAGLPPQVKEDARSIAVKMIEGRIVTRVQPDIVALASVVVSCRLNKVGIGLKQLSMLTPSKHNPKMISRRAFELARRYVEVYKPQMDVARYEDYVRVASQILGVPEDMERVAEELVRAFKERYGRRLKPMAVAGAAIYVALRRTGEQRLTISSISSKLKVTEPTLRNAIRYFNQLSI
jgi:transcription initiation factor TFIIIB Brf1 subunit/transcription initiation factor TFIIB